MIQFLSVSTKFPNLEIIKMREKCDHGIVTTWFCFKQRFKHENDCHDAADIDIMHTFKLYDVWNLSFNVRFVKRKLF